MDDLSFKLGEGNDGIILGEGLNGIVYLWEFNGKRAAAKVPRTDSGLLSLVKEAGIYKHLCKVFAGCSCNPTLVEMYHFDSDKFVLVLEFFEGLDLARYLNYPISDARFLTHRLLPREESGGDAEWGVLSYYMGTDDDRESIVLKMFSLIYQGILCLHGAKVRHKDFELKNILIKQGKIGIADFGGSQILRYSPKTSTGGYVINFQTLDDLMLFFARDLSSIGPMMRNFLDAKNQRPYQERLDKKFPVAEIPITDPVLSNVDMVLSEFPQIPQFVSAMHLIKLTLTRPEQMEILSSEISHNVPRETIERIVAFDEERFRENKGFEALAEYADSIILALWEELGYDSDVTDLVTTDFLLRHFDLLEQTFGVPPN
jgi:serine/threonine protein kinase